MRIHFVKFLYSSIILSGIGIRKLSAQVTFSDTTKLAAVSKKEVEYKSSVIPANIIFPASLENSKDQSLDYIEKFSAKKRAFLLRTYETGKKYFPKIISVLKQYQMPEELKVLIALESNFSGNVVSRAGAVGYWQIMDRVAKQYGLQIAANKNTAKRFKKTDDRKNFIKSTLAAIKYLRDQQLPLNSDILLMVAAYNCGPGTISRAIKRSQRTDPTFWDLKNFLPKETRNYVMNFIALNVIFTNFENFEKGQLLFEPKVVDIPFPAPEINNSIPVEAAAVN